MENINEEQLQQMLQEAEQRGYERGLNEQIEKAMDQPGVWEQPPDSTPPDPTAWEILSKLKNY